ncbi:MAG TPA: hypothetical protein VFY71_05190 [Planctomycetota bacterium]|nr:hypothetical protein [Planctomycetota bacterium]
MNPGDAQVAGSLRRGRPEKVATPVPAGRSTRPSPAGSLWIRGPWWDSFWILSGLPLAGALLLLSPSIYLVLAVTILLEHAHFLSPMTLAWTHRGFRAVMLRKKGKFIFVPLAIIAATTAIGILTSRFVPDLHVDVGTQVRVYDFADYKQPFVMLVVLYFLWNNWHFGMQNFGVLSIYRRKSGSGTRRKDMLYCLGVQFASAVWAYWRVLGLERGHMQSFYFLAAAAGVVAMLLTETRWSPRILFIVADAVGLMFFLQSFLWGFAIWSMNHWLVALGLSSHVYGSERGRSPLPFVLGLAAAGVLVFWVLFGTGVNLSTIFDPKFVVKSTIVLMSVRYGVAFTHFLYDRWLWSFGNPDVRATIGKSLFA